MADVTHADGLVDRPRLSVGGVVKTTFRVFGRAPVLFLLSGLVGISPSVARLILLPASIPRFDVTAAVVLVLNLLLVSFIQAALTLVVVRLHDNQRVPIGEASAHGMRRFLPMLGTSVLVVLAVYAGLFLLIVPGLLLGVIFAVAAPACALETGGPIVSMKRSIFLTKGERWPIFGIFCIFFIPMIIVSGASAVLLTMKGHLVAGQWVSLAIQVVWTPLAVIFSSMIYVELRRLKETVGVARIFD